MMLARITDTLAAAGCAFPDINLLQPADPFLDTTGEDLRRRIFITAENSGAMLCLRPEFTVPVCIHHLENATGHRRYGYGGTVFRQRLDAPAEFVQAGYEDLGNPDRQQAEIECINTAAGLLSACGIEGMRFVLGDQSAFMAVLEALEIPEPWRKKLLRAFGDTALLKQQIEAMSSGETGGAGPLPEDLDEALATGDQARVAAVVSQAMVADGLPLTGGRTAGAIAERLLEKRVIGATRLANDQRTALEAFLDIDTGLSQAAEAIAAFEADTGLALPGTAERLAGLADRMAALPADRRFRARFGRRLDYYTGLVFEFYRPGLEKPLIGGGRYDGLLTLLGAKSEIPAVGFAVWIDRLEASS